MWKEVKGVDGYNIYRYNGKKDILIGNVDNKVAEYQIEKLKGSKGKSLQPATKYTFKVEAYKNISGKKYYGERVKIETYTKPDVVKIKKVERISNKKAKIQWKKVDKATGYVVYYAEDKNGVYRAKTVEGKGKNSCIIKGLKKEKIYYIRVCAYKKHGGNTWYGNYYKTKKIPKK